MKKFGKKGAALLTRPLDKRIHIFTNFEPT